MQNNFKDDLTNLLVQKKNKISDVSQLINNFSKVNIYVIGKNEDSLNVFDKISVDGIIDDFNVGKSWNGHPLVSMHEIDKQSIVINCVTSISPITVLNLLRARGFNNVINLSDLIDTDLFELNEPWFVKEAKESLKVRANEWDILYNHLEDEKSRSILLKIVAFRLTADLEHMKHFKVRLEDQYFENFMSYDEEFFVDAGGYDGDTTELFCKKYPNYSQVYFFEPSPDNLQMAKKRLKSIDRIQFFDLGLSSEKSILSFDSTKGSASSVENKGDINIKTVRLDDFILDKVSFIKMDIEGWELEALKGSKDHILNNKPKLAIAVYHSINDFLDISKFILNICPNYRIYLRHYTEGWSESVMYFKNE